VLNQVQDSAIIFRYQKTKKRESKKNEGRKTDSTDPLGLNLQDKNDFDKVGLPLVSLY